MFVKLQRPPPEIPIFLPTRSECSRTRTLRPRLPASIAQKRPAAPPPMTMTSHFIESFSNPKYSTDYADYADKTKRRQGRKQGQDKGAGTDFFVLLSLPFPNLLSSLSVQSAKSVDGFSQGVVTNGNSTKLAWPGA